TKNPIGTRRHLNFSLLIFLCDTTRHSSSDSAKYFRKSRSSAPVIIKPIKIQYSPCLFGLGAPVEWCKCITDFAYCLVPDLLASFPKMPSLYNYVFSCGSLKLKAIPRARLTCRIAVHFHLREGRKIFGMATTAHRERVLSELWPVRLGATDDASEIPLAAVVLPQQEHEGSSNRMNMVYGLDDTLLTNSWLGESARYELRYFGMLRDMDDTGHQAEREPPWYLVGDGDTLWTDERILRQELGTYDPTKSWLLGCSSEEISQIQQFGNRALGGAEIIIAR
ncbi:hypothetical protein PSHT_08644, partial [Puccinia striiformis]